MEHLVIAIILLIGPDHSLVGGKVLPGASADMPSCEKKASLYLQHHMDALPPNVTAVQACAVLATDTST